MQTVRVQRIAPFKDGHDVVGLYCSYSETLVATVKTELARLRRQGVKQPGGWLDSPECWWCEEEVWPALAAALSTGGFTFEREAPVSERMPPRNRRFGV